VFPGRPPDESQAQNGQTDPAESAGRIVPVGEPSGDRRGETDRHRPGRHQQPGLDRRSAEHLLDEERQRDKRKILRREREQIEVTTDSVKTGRAKSSSASIG
jgi:hypothetical protein